MHNAHTWCHGRYVDRQICYQLCQHKAESLQDLMHTEQERTNATTSTVMAVKQVESRLGGRRTVILPLDLEKKSDFCWHGLNAHSFI